MINVPEQMKLPVDGIAIAAWVSALSGVLTNMVGLLAALASLVWGCIRVYETKTFQNWLTRKRAKHVDK